MLTRTLGSLGAMVRRKRGEEKLRETAQQIGISAATLLRVESGRIPDVETFGKVCHWLGEDPGSFLGFEPEKAAKVKEEPEPLFFSAHLKIDQSPLQETISAIAKMIFFAAQSQHSTMEINEDGDS